MTTNDKTRQQLVDTMRKTKAGATKKKPVAADSKTTKGDIQPAKKTAEKPVKRPDSTLKKRNSQADPYQIGRRVWPD